MTKTQKYLSKLFGFLLFYAFFASFSVFAEQSVIEKGVSFSEDFTSGERILDSTPELFLKISADTVDKTKQVTPIVQIASDSQFSSVLYEKQGDSFFTIDPTNPTASTSIVLDDPSLDINSGQYFVRVRSLDQEGKESSWGPTFRFEKIFDSDPEVSSLQIFESGTTNGVPNGSSTSASGIDVKFVLSDPNTSQKLTHQVQIAFNTAFDPLYQDIPSVEYKPAGERSINIPFLNPSEEYFIRVRAIDEGGNIGNWSNIRSFRTLIKKPEALSLKAKNFSIDGNPYKFFSGSNVVISDSLPIFNFTLPNSSTLPVFTARSVKGKSVAYSQVLSFENNSFTNETKEINISASQARLGENSLFGILKAAELGFIYLDKNSAPSLYHQYFPASFAAIENDKKGNLSQKAWSNIYGWITFSAEIIPASCTTPASFEKNSHFTCVDKNGNFQGYAKIDHASFTLDGLKNYFLGDWNEAKRYFIDGENSSVKIFNPLLDEQEISEITNTNVKSKLQTLWAKDGGYIKFSDQNIDRTERMNTQWREDGIQKLMNISAGVQNSENAKITLEGNTLSTSDANYSVLHLSGDKWEQKSLQTFDISTDSAKAHDLKTFLENIPVGDIIVVATGKNPSSEVNIFANEMIAFGADRSIFQNISENDSYIFIGRKGKITPFFEQETSGANSSFVNTADDLVEAPQEEFPVLMGTAESQSMGSMFFSMLNGGVELPLGDERGNGSFGLVGTMYSAATGLITFDSDGEFGSSNSGDDYGVTIDSVDGDGNIYFSGKAWGSGTGFIEISRGVKTGCQAVDTPNSSNFGVCRDSSGAFHGFAWSPSFGWISFENVYAPDQFSSLGYEIELTTEGESWTYTARDIPAGNLLIPTESLIQASTGEDCSVDIDSCRLEYGRYEWKVRTLVEDSKSEFSPTQYFNLQPKAPILNHQCLDTISSQQSFEFTAQDTNTPASGIKSRVNFVDTAAASDFIASLVEDEYKNPENNMFITDQKDFSAYNEKTINYTLIAENEFGATTEQLCENVLVRALGVQLTTPLATNEGVSTSTPFEFTISTILNDEYQYTVEIRENTEGSNSHDPWPDNPSLFFSSPVQSVSDAKETNYHSETVPVLPINTDLCWRVTATSTQDGMAATSGQECFSTSNAAPSIKDLKVVGNSVVLSPSQYVVATQDTMPTLSFQAIDDSLEVTANVKLLKVSSGTAVEVDNSTQTLSNGSWNYSLKLPSEHQLSEDLSSYRFEVELTDSQGLSSQFETRNFLYYKNQRDIGFGNIGTENIINDPSSASNGGQKIDHRFAFDTENRVGVVDFNPISGGVHVDAEKVSGYAWNNQTGWIRFSCNSIQQMYYEGTPLIKDIIDSADPYCEDTSGTIIEKYGVYPGYIDATTQEKKIGLIRDEGSNPSQDLLGKAKFEIIGDSGDLKIEFLYFDLETYKEDFGSGANWPLNEMGSPAVGVDADGKISGSAWSPSFGWISMGKDNPNWGNNYPITEYTLGKSQCLPSLISDKENTFTARDTLEFPVAEMCEDKKFESCDLTLVDSLGNATTIDSNTSCKDKDKILVDIPSTKAEMFSLYGEIIDSAGKTIEIEQFNPINIKIIADSVPDFSNASHSSLQISYNDAYANGIDVNTLELELKDKYGNKIFADSDIAGERAKDVAVKLNFQDDIRLDQVNGSSTGQATTIAGSALAAPIKSGSNKEVHIVSENSETVLTDQNDNHFVYNVSSYAPTSDNDTFELEEINLNITDRLDADTVYAYASQIEAGATPDAGKKIKLAIDEPNGNTTEISPLFNFQKIFTATSEFESETLNENALEAAPYKISLTPKEAENMDITSFHFLHCLDTPESGLVEFTPLVYTDDPSNEAANCYEFSTTSGAPSQFALQKDRSFNPSAVDNTNIVIPDEDTQEYTFETFANRSSTEDTPSAIDTFLYVAFKVPGKNWVKYPLTDNSLQSVKFNMETGYIEGFTQGESVDANTVSTKESGLFSQVYSVETVQQIRAILTNSLYGYINAPVEKVTKDSVTLSSDKITQWLKGEKTPEELFPDISMNSLEKGNMIWIQGDGDLVVKLGEEGGIIDDEGNEISKTIIVEGGNLEINSDIFRRKEGVLALVVLQNPDQIKDESQIKNSGNILINPEVRNIRAMMYADGSLFSYGLKDGDSEKTIYDGFDDRETRSADLQNQLYIRGSISSLNTYGGASDHNKILNIKGEEKYVNTLEHHNVWQNNNFNAQDEQDRKAEAIRFDFKRLREFDGEIVYLDDLDKDGVRDDLDRDMNGDGEITADDIQYCIDNKASLSENEKVACTPKNPSYGTEFSAQPSFFNKDEKWSKDTALKSRAAVIFEYDISIPKNPPPGVLIYSDFKSNFKID